MKNIEELNQRLSEIEREKRGISLEDALKKEMAEYKGDDEVVSFEEYKRTHADLIKKGFSSGVSMLDEIIEGFHEGDLITITSSTGMGKTSWCQFLTSNFSKIGIKSLWFSYEVPTINFLAKFGDNLPDGYLPKILTDRRMVWIERKIIEGIVKFGIKVIFIDHLHYLFNLGESKNVSLEIGEIMRSLKIIAKKYNITIFIISHTKKIEEMGVIGLDSLRDCLPKGQLVYSNGNRIPIERLKKGMSVVSKGTSFRLQKDKVKNYWNTGKKKIYRLTTKTGCEIKCSDGQKFLASTFKKGKEFKPNQGLGIAGWTELKKLKIGQKIAIIKKYPDIKKETITPEMALLLGWVIGDGHITPKGYTEISIEKENECLFLKKIADKSFNLNCLFNKCNGKNAYRFYLTKGRINNHGKNEWVEWLRKLKFNPIGKDKYVPSIIFKQSNRVIGAFLSGLFQADGSVCNSGYEKSPTIILSTISDRLAQDIHHLLKRLGIISYKRNHIMKKSGFRPSTGRINEISIGGVNVIKFKELVGLYCYKKEKLEKIIVGYKPQVSDKKSDLYFDRIKRIEYVREEETWDIEVRGHHSSLPNHTYCVNDILTHNSSFTGQESDYVIALWRIKEKQTRKDIEEFGLQYRNETIISVIKNRYNGQLKSFKLYFKDNSYYESVEDSLT